MRNDLSMFFDDFFTRGLSATSNMSYPPVNIYKRDGNVVLEMAVAGFKRDELSVDYDGQQLTVSGRKMSPAEDEAKQWITRELSARAFTRKFAISGQYEPDQPTLDDGILMITLKGQNTKRSLPILQRTDIPQLTG